MHKPVLLNSALDINWNISKRFLLVFLSIVVLLSCEENGFLDAGEETTISRELDNFNTVCVNDIFALKLVQDTINKIEITTGENLVDQISTKISDTTLCIDNENMMRWSRDYEDVKLRLHLRNLRKLRLNAPCDVTTANAISSYKIDVWNIANAGTIEMQVETVVFYFVNSSTSTGDFHFSGTTRIAGCWIRGSGHYNSMELMSEFTNIHQSSIADAYVYSGNALNVWIDSKANLYYTGEPDTIIVEENTPHEQLTKLERIP